MVRLAPDNAAPAAGWPRGEPQARAAPDADHGADADLPAAADERPAPRALCIPLSAARNDDRARQPGVVRRREYVPMRRGFLYLVAIMDWATRKVLAWRVSNTLDAGFCVEALQAALARHGRPAIFNTDQGSQFTSFAFTAVLRDAEVRISMDGRGRCMDNVFIERLWRSLKYECVYLHAFETGSELRAGLERWIGYYNGRRPHSTLAGQTPDEAYAAGTGELRLAA